MSITTYYATPCAFYTVTHRCSRNLLATQFASMVALITSESVSGARLQVDAPAQITTTSSPCPAGYCCMHGPIACMAQTRSVSDVNNTRISVLHETICPHQDCAACLFLSSLQTVQKGHNAVSLGTQRCTPQICTQKRARAVR
jgi:hypothetical protein